MVSASFRKKFKLLLAVMLTAPDEPKVPVLLPFPTCKVPAVTVVVPW